MAGEQPKETKEAIATPSDVPGGFPDTPAEELDKPVSVSPLPAATGAVNPVKLEPGEKVPEIATEDINSNVKLDKESYEKSDTLPGVETQPAIAAKPVIPESGLPVTDNTINSVGPTATTAALAGQVPKESKESKVPHAVKESQEKAGAAPEASADPEEVEEKVEVEEELKQKVPEAAISSEGTAGVGTEKTEQTGGAIAAITTAGGAAAGVAIAAKDAAVEKTGPAVNQAATTAADAANKNLPDSVKEKLPVAAQEALASQNKEEKREEVSPEVPSEVKQSITEAGKSPEAAGNTAAVEEKKDVESELLKEVKPNPADGETKGEDVKPESKPEEPVTDAGKTAEPLKLQEEKAAANGSGSRGAANGANGSESKPADTSATDKKRKNRLSAMLSKIKHKISDKN